MLARDRNLTYAGRLKVDLTVTCRMRTGEGLERVMESRPK